MRCSMVGLLSAGRGTLGIGGERARVRGRGKGRGHGATWVVPGAGGGISKVPQRAECVHSS